MPSTFKNALSLTGFSQREASVFFDVREDTVKSWCSGRNNPPKGVWLMLAERMRAILDAADNAADVLLLDGIDPRAWSQIEACHADDSALDQNGEHMAGALALLMAIDDQLGG